MRALASRRLRSVPRETAWLLVGLFLVPVLAASFWGALPAGASAAHPRRESADLLLYNGKVFVGDAAGTFAEAVAIRGERILAVGAERDLARRFRSRSRLDLKGRLVTPGFNDSHVHFSEGALRSGVDLRDARSPAEVARRVATQRAPPGAWIVGSGWDETLWAGAAPSRAILDRVAPRNPLYLVRIDGHVAWVNTRALERAGIDDRTADPPGGKIVRDDRGRATGVLEETAKDLVAGKIPVPSRRERKTALEAAVRTAREYGITSVQDASGAEALDLYGELLRQGALTVRVAVWQVRNRPLAELLRQRAAFSALGFDPLRLRITAAKSFVDGSLGARTAALLAPYADAPSRLGLLRIGPGELAKLVEEEAGAGLQVALHAIGDRANRVALDAIQAARRPELRPRIEHAQVIAPPDLTRFRTLSVIVAMQPVHVSSDSRWAEGRLGLDRARLAYAWRSLLRSGAHVAFGTDWPVEPLDPYRGLYAAVTRERWGGGPPGGWNPEERLTIEEALRCYTAGGAYASFEEREKGMIAPGMLADLVVHTRDLLTIDPRAILRTKVALTIFGGRIVYRSAGTLGP